MTEAERYAIARFFGEAAPDAKTQTRARATRAQVRQYALSALTSSVKATAEGLAKKRHRTRAAALLAGDPPERAALPEPSEQQLRLVEA